MKVEPDLETPMFSSLQKPDNGLFGSVSAANVRSILVNGPVSDGQADPFDLSLGEVLQGLVGDPALPMSSEHFVSFLWPESLTESVLVGTHTLRVGLVEESVEEGWCDPWLKDLPPTNVGSNNGLVICESNGC